MKRSAWAGWFFDRFLDYEREKGAPANVAEFGRLFGFSQPLTSQYMSGEKVPGIRNLEKIEARYPGAFEAAGVERPQPTYADPVQRLANEAWPYMTEEERNEIAEIVRLAIERRAQGQNGEVGPGPDDESPSG